MVRFNTVWEVYEYISKKKEVTEEDISAEFGFSIKKVRKIVKKLISSGVIFEKDRKYHPVLWSSFVNLNDIKGGVS